MSGGSIVIVHAGSIREFRIVVTAERIVSTDEWLVICRVDGELHAAEKSHDPAETAARMVATIHQHYA